MIVLRGTAGTLPGDGQLLLPAMGTAKVRGDAAGLTALAGRQLATTIGAASVPTVSGLAGQPSVAAVQTARIAVAAASARLTARMTDTATTAQAAAGCLVTNEDSSAQIAAVSPGLTQV